MTRANLSAAGLRSTGARRRVLSILESSDTSHRSIEEIHQALTRSDPIFSIATLYRVLSDFESAGIVVRRHLGPSLSVYVLKVGRPHGIVICLSCGKSQEFDDPALLKRQSAIGKSLGFAIVDRALTLYGHCRDCRSAPVSEPKQALTQADRLRGARLLTAKRRLRNLVGS